MRKPMLRKRPAERGFVLITTVLSLVVLAAFLGLAVDVGYVQLVKTRMQTAADAAALGGAQEMKANGSSAVVTAARGDAALNGFTDGRNGVAVTVNNPPTSGYYQSDSTAVEVIIAQSVPAFFLELAGTSSTNVRARAVARQESGTSCLYMLDPSSSGTLSASGGATVQVNCGVVDNSSNSRAVTLSGGARIAATSVSIVGNYSVSGGASISPAPTTGVTADGDPLSYLPTPSVGACTQTNLSVSGGNTKTLDPGVYCNGLRLSGGAVVTLNPGVYIMEGGGLSVSGGARLSGTGVMFYLTAGSGYGYGAVNLSGGTTVILAAPTTDSYAGILFYQDRSISSGTASSFSGGTGAVLQGAVYFPTTSLTYSGGSTSAAYTVLVAKAITFSGGTTLNSDYSSLPAGSPVKGGAAVSE